MLTRRQLLQMGFIGGAAALLPWERAVVALASGHSTPRFAVELPVPPVLAPTATDGSADYYDIEMRPADVEILPGLLTPVWAYNGIFPGPTITARRNRTTVVTQSNALEVPTSIHLHGAHVSPESDGHPNDIIEPGSSKVYTYPNSQLAATLWYHDHVMHETSRNVYMGLAGAYLIGDEVEDAIDLPRGEHDIPLLITDRSFEADGSLDFSGSMDRVIGNTILVNGKPWPYLPVGTRRYRLRFVNASNSRDYELALDSGADLVQVASDGGLLAAPYATPSILIAPAERVEVVIDFSAVPVGTSVVLKNLLGNPATGTDDVMRFDVARQESDPTGIPPALRDIPPPLEAGITRDFDLTFDVGLGLWTINGRPFDADRVDVRPQQDVPEIWRVTNSAGAAHPFHIHLSMFRILDRDGEPPHPGEAGWKDTVQVNPGEAVRFVTVFSGFTGRYVYHCHNLAHEDHDMMAQMEVEAGQLGAVQRLGGANRYATAAMVSAATFAAGVPVVFVATGRDYPDALAAGAAAAVEGGPVLLVGPQEVPGETAAELARLAPGRIVLLGGERAVDESVAGALGEFGPVQRLGGANRYATAAMVSAATFAAGVPVVFVATGRDYPDALAAGAAAAVEGGPVLLVGPQEVPGETAAELARLAPGRIVLLGGERAVGASVSGALGEFGPVQRLGGADRYATAAMVSAATFHQADIAFVATGQDYPDALCAAGPAAGAGSPVLLVGSDAVPDIVTDELRRLAATRVVLLGGERAVSAAVADGLRAALG